MTKIFGFWIGTLEHPANMGLALTSANLGMVHTKTHRSVRVIPNSP